MDKKDIPSYDELLVAVRKTINTAWNIENKIHQPNIDKWLNNFTGKALCSDILTLSEAEELEKQLALFLLCNFVFYNENKIKYLTKKMFEIFIHYIFKDEKYVDDEAIHILLDKTRFTFLGQSSESSSYLLYHFRQENDLSRNNFFVSENTDNIVFVDDFSISGSQVISYLDEYFDLYPLAKSKNIFLLIMITTEFAINKLKNYFSNVIVLPCIVMDNRSRVFSDTSIVFNGYKDDLKLQAKKMCEFYGSKLVDINTNMTPIGYGGAGYMFGSYYNIPDNTLPIFWANKNGWHYLFKRHHKIYDTGISLGGRYV